jgi:hypothetical protein
MLSPTFNDGDALSSSLQRRIGHGRDGSGSVAANQALVRGIWHRHWCGSGAHANLEGDGGTCPDGIGGLVDGLNGPHRWFVDFFVFY